MRPERLPRPEPVRDRAPTRSTCTYQSRQAQCATAKEVGHASCFFALEARRYVGVRDRPDATHKDSRVSRVRSPSAASRSQPTPRRVVVPPRAAIPHRDRCDAETTASGDERIRQ